MVTPEKRCAGFPRLVIGPTSSFMNFLMRVMSLVVALLIFHDTLSVEIIKSHENYQIYYPFRKWRSSSRIHSLLSPPRVWIHHFLSQLESLSHLTQIENDFPTTSIAARDLYLQALFNFLMGDYLGIFERSVQTTLQHQENKLAVSPVNSEFRQQGLDWPLFGMTMTGRIRMATMKTIVEEVISNQIPGDVIETGVWRGGLSIFMRGILIASNESHRKSYVCDSFAGLPSSQLKDDSHLQWDQTPYLEISDEHVMKNFISAGIIDPEIIFVKGFFSHSMKPLSQLITQLSILRLDGDMYESTVDVLYHLYDKLSIGGYVYIDDYSPHFPARAACEHFFQVHDFLPKIIEPDSLSGYWKKTEEIQIQYWRYVEKKFQN
jgi:O-methyltransferase